MPSVLIETGFLTNPGEEKFLNDPVNQIKMANTIFKAFQEYVAEIDGVNTLVENGKGYEASIEEIKAQEAEEKVILKEEENKVYFKIQIETSREKLSLNDKRFKNVRSEEHTSELQSRPHLVC